MKSFIVVLIGMLCFSISVASHAQPTVMDLKKLGEEAYEAGRYREAVNMLEKFNEYKSQNLDVLTALGISYYHINRLADGLKSMLLVINNDRRPDEKLYFYAGRAYHHLEEFEKAAKYYKKYIAKGSHEKLIEAAKAHLLRCASAQKIIHYDPLIFVDNMGSSVNSILDDYHPVTSPSSSSRLYFSSQVVPDGKFPTDEEGNIILPKTDMFATTLINGSWQGRDFMNPDLNTEENEILYAFSDNGEVAYYFQGDNRIYGKLYTDTFSVKKKNLPKKAISIPADPTYGDCDVQFINDTTILFASNRKEGYGGYDLYVSQFKDGKWQKPRNLGETVNTEYNERSPYITNDLLTIVFSSDRPYSMGGYDFFIGKWDDKLRKITDVKNAGKPLNSPGNDLFLTMSLDGITCYFSSDRKTGVGNYDLYTGYFKSPLSPSQTPFPALVTHLVEGPDSSSIAYAQGAGLTTKTKNIEIESLIYKEGDVLNRRNSNELNELVDIMNAYPLTNLRIQVFSNTELSKSLDLYFSIKTGEQVSDYLINKGIDGQRIQITGCGSAYPLAMSRYIGGGHIPERVNSRIDFQLINTDNYKLNIKYSLPEVPPDADKSAYKIFQSYSQGLSYRVQIAALSQKYSSPLLSEKKNALISKSGNGDTYKYTLGLFTGYEKASKFKEKLQSEGLSEAFVVPFVLGMRKSREELKNLQDTYPDLENYLIGTLGK